MAAAAPKAKLFLGRAPAGFSRAAWSIFKPSGFTWRLGKYDQTDNSFSSQVASLGGSENATKQKLREVPVNERERKPL
jgi:hypothetical protein